MKIGARIKSLRINKGFTQEELANTIGTTKQTIFKYESGIITNIPSSKIIAIAEVLHTTPAYLMGWVDDETEVFPQPNVSSEYVTFPVVGEIAAGYDHLALENYDSGDYVDIPVSMLKGRAKSDFFVLRVNGDSMYPLYMDGDKVLIKKTPTLDYSGQVGALLYGENATLKRIEYVTGEDWLRMVPVNANFPPTRIECADLEQCRVLGVPVLLIRDVEE